MSDEHALCQVGLVCGFAEISGTWMEVAYQLALNNITVHIMDNDTFGYSSGFRGRGPQFEKMHHNMTCMVQ